MSRPRSVEQILVKKLTVAPAPLPERGDFGKLILAMLDARPEHRPASTLAISAYLRRLKLLSDAPPTDEVSTPGPDDSFAPELFDRTAVDPPRSESIPSETTDAPSRSAFEPPAGKIVVRKLDRKPVSVPSTASSRTEYPVSRSELRRESSDADPTVRGQSGLLTADTPPRSPVRYDLEAASSIRSPLRARADPWDKVATQKIPDSAPRPSPPAPDRPVRPVALADAFVVAAILSAALVVLFLAIAVYFR